ncbi:DUF7619 domain-containing protein [Rufibacter roseus]|uniref:T9SS type A sorting domain-containing protein n=1 Tax=Rufibacter roseus TaxID=1567108 RepID=A0ABW2DEH3_9BACT|nr:T9SS type A sorting domain-containing protein [Rufibacter roseus]
MKYFVLKIIISLVLLFSSPIKAQYAENIQAFGGKYDDYITEILHDKEGNRFVMGSIGSPNYVSFPEYTGEEVEFGDLKQKIVGGFIAKFNRKNEVLWIYETPTFSRGYERGFIDMTIDDEGFLYVTGYVPSSHGFILDKLDKNGNIVWSKNYKDPNKPSEYVLGRNIVVDKQGNVYVVGEFDGVKIENFVFNETEVVGRTEFFAKYNSVGELLWVQTSSKNDIVYTNIFIDSKGNVITIGGFKNTVNFSGLILENKTAADYNGSVYDRFIVKSDTDGKAFFAKSYQLRSNGIIKNVFLDEKDNVYMSAQGYYTNSSPWMIGDIEVKDTFGEVLVKFDPSGSPQWVTSYQGSYSTSESFLHDGENIYIAGIFDRLYRFKGKEINLSENQEGGVFLLSLNSKGEAQEIKIFGGVGAERHAVLSNSPNKNGVILGFTFYDEIYNSGKFKYSKGKGDIFIGTVLDSLSYTGNETTKISGKLFLDINFNCLNDSLENGLANKIIKIDPGSYYAKTNESGEFAVRLEPGNYSLTPLVDLASKSQITQSCLPSINIDINSGQLEVPNLNFGYSLKECAVVSIDIATDRRRRCFRSNTVVTYANDGTADAHNVRIKVIYPEYVVPISSSLPWAARQGSDLLFDIGTLKAGARLSFTIADSTICGNEGIRGLSQCIQAFITPKSTCEIPNQGWDESSVTLSANFIEEEKVAAFTISNEGAADMTDSTTYRLYANAALVKRGKVKLEAGASTSLEVPAQITTLRLEADQVPHHPGNSQPVVSLQPKSIPPDFPSMALPLPIDAFYMDEADTETDISCLPITDSYDPNDKQVSPQGISQRHYIKENQDLEYLVRFQNTGTDVAYNVIIKDTINDNLDIASLRVGSASHPFTYTVSGKGKPVITFTFRNINLPDHKTNEPGSHGFVKFSIAQNLDNPKGTVITNKADIYFDYNSPIITNEVFNIIGDTVLAPPMPVVVYDCGIETPATAVAGADISLCETNIATLQANAPEKGIGRWRLISGQATIVSPENPTTEIRNIGYGETVLEWVITLCKKTSASQVKINRYQIPPAPEVAEPGLQCEGAALLPLVATGNNIKWYEDAEKKQELAVGNSFTPIVSSTTTFFASQTVNGCESPASAVTVKVHPSKVAVTVNADTLFAPTAHAYQWYFNGAPLAGETGQKLVAQNTGRYWLKTYTNGCESRSDEIEHEVRVDQSLLTISPNPVQEALTIKFVSHTTGEVNFIIRDMVGRTILKAAMPKGLTVSENSLQVSALAPGVYLLELQIGKEVLKTKFVKQ